MLLFSCQPVHVAGAGSRTPACTAGLQLDPADGSQRSQTRKAGGGGEDMNQSGVPLLAGGSWPVRQLPITQPGSVYSRSTTPPSPSPPGRRGERAAGMGTVLPLLLSGFGDGPPPRPPASHVCRSCHPPASGAPNAHSLGCRHFCLSLIKRQPATPHASRHRHTTPGQTHGQPSIRSEGVPGMLHPPQARQDAGNLPSCHRGHP